ncbi:hypothetical protein [Paraburkholderia sp.]|uniref:hypothetical protein n=1 Tax=Paraburkholderia sp. TaxID=1926495 RepID=UPI003D6E65D9
MATRKKAITSRADATAIVQAEAHMNIVQREDDAQIALALEKYGFKDYTLGRLVAEGSLRAKRFVEDILELGRIVLTCRELPRGMYGHAIAQMGISPDTARRVAGVALKFWNKEHLKPLLSLDTSKIYELALLDDASLDAIVEDGAMLDECDRMSVSELRAAFRESRAQIEAKDAVAGENQKTIQKLKEKLSRSKPTPEFLAQENLEELGKESVQCVARISAGMRAALGTAMASIDTHGADRHLVEQSCASAIGNIFAALRSLAADFDITPQTAGVNMSIEADPSWAHVKATISDGKANGNGRGKRNA